MSQTKDKIKVGILRGGENAYYTPSLIKGGEIISHIFDNLSEKYKVLDILIDKKGVWHLNGIPVNPADLSRKVDIIWNTSRQPSFSQLLQGLSIPSVGNESFVRVLESNREMFRSHMKNIGVRMPKSVVLSLFQEDFDLRYAEGFDRASGPKEEYAVRKAREIFEKFSSPWMVKYLTDDAGMGIHLAKTFPELVRAIEDGVEHNRSITVEEFITGRALGVYSINGFRREDIYVITPDKFTVAEKEKLASIVKDVHKYLGVENFMKSDFILHPKMGFFLTNIDYLPDLREGSHFYLACEYVGAKMHHILDHILEKAINKRT